VNFSENLIKAQLKVEPSSEWHNRRCH